MDQNSQNNFEENEQKVINSYLTKCKEKLEEIHIKQSNISPMQKVFSPKSSKEYNDLLFTQTKMIMHVTEIAELLYMYPDNTDMLMQEFNKVVDDFNK